MSDYACKIRSTYVNVCDKPGEVCKPIEGHFCTECEVKGCNKLC